MMRFDPDNDSTLYSLFGPVTDDPAERFALLALMVTLALSVSVLAAGVVALVIDGPTVALWTLIGGALLMFYLAFTAEVR